MEWTPSFYFSSFFPTAGRWWSVDEGRLVGELKQYVEEGKRGKEREGEMEVVAKKNGRKGGGRASDFGKSIMLPNLGICEFPSRNFRFVGKWNDKSGKGGMKLSSLCFFFLALHFQLH